MRGAPLGRSAVSRSRRRGVRETITARPRTGRRGDETFGGSASVAEDERPSSLAREVAVSAGRARHRRTGPRPVCRYRAVAYHDFDRPHSTHGGRTPVEVDENARDVGSAARPTSAPSSRGPPSRPVRRDHLDTTNHPSARQAARMAFTRSGASSCSACPTSASTIERAIPGRRAYQSASVGP